MRSRIPILAGAVIIALTSASVASASLPVVALELEQNVHALATEAEALHTNRCSLLNTCGGDCTVPGCAKTWDADDGFACNENYGGAFAVDDDATIGGLAKCPTQIRSLSTTIVRLPTTTHANARNEEFVCSTRKIETKMAAQQASGNLSSWQYVSNSEGGLRLYPGSPQDNGGQCDHYDARLRPWYLAAANGPRDVVILLSTSNNTNGAKFVLSKCVADTVLRSLGPNDFVDLVAFNAGVHSFGGDMLNQATVDNVDKLQAALNILNFDDRTSAGKVSFRTAFSKGFEELFSSTRSSNCQKVIIFLTDGAAPDSHLAVSHIQNLKTQYGAVGSRRVSIFTYGVKLEPLSPIYHFHQVYRSNLIDIACDNYGVYGGIDSRDNPVASLNAYTRMLSANINGDTSVRWTSNYSDAFGMGDLVTASRPIWDRTTSVPFLVGVVGIDLPTSKLGDERTATLNALYEKSTFCPEFNVLSDCQMQIVRQESTGYLCPNGPSIDSCKATTTMTPPLCEASALKGTSERFCQPSGENSLATEDYTCCGMDACGGSESLLERSHMVLAVAAMVVTHLHI